MQTHLITISLSVMPLVGLPRKQQIGVKQIWIQNFEIGEECRQFRT